MLPDRSRAITHCPLISGVFTDEPHDVSNPTTTKGTICQTFIMSTIDEFIIPTSQIYAFPHLPSKTNRNVTYDGMSYKMFYFA